MQASEEAKYYRELADSCRAFLDVFGQEEHAAQEKQSGEASIASYRRKLEKKLAQFDSNLEGLMGERSSE